MKCVYILAYYSGFKLFGNMDYNRFFWHTIKKADKASDQNSDTVFQCTTKHSRQENESVVENNGSVLISHIVDQLISNYIEFLVTNILQDLDTSLQESWLLTILCFKQSSCSVLSS